MEKLGLVLTGIFSLFIIVWALASMIIALQASDAAGFAAGLIFLLIGAGVEAFIFRVIKKTIYMEMLVDSAFEEGLYTRLGPVLSSISDVGVNVADIEKRMDQITYRLDELKEKEGQPAAFQSGFIIKSIFVLNVTLAAVVFLSLNPLAGTHFILTAVYLIWWLLITSDFKLFGNVRAWYYCFGIIILIPLAVILLNAFFELRVMMAILFLGIAVFAISYYSWCAYITRGELPFNIHNELRYGLMEIQKKELQRK